MKKELEAKPTLDPHLNRSVLLISTLIVLELFNSVKLKENAIATIIHETFIIHRNSKFI
jgi:hypothetical protein